MIPGENPMTVVAAALIRREKDAVAVFRAAGAISSETARPPESLGVTSDMTIRRLEARAVLRPGRQPGTLYLDEPSWAATNWTRRRLALVVLVIAVFGSAVAFFTMRQAAR
jgi:hypothetical protein